MEIWDLYDKDKNMVGLTHQIGKESEIPNGMYHLAVEIWTIMRIKYS